MPELKTTLRVDEFPHDPLTFFPGNLTVLGSGGFSRILGAVDRQRQDNVAVKLFELHYEEFYRESYEKELEFYMNMEHLNRSWMPQYYSTGENTRELQPWISIERLHVSLHAAIFDDATDAFSMFHYAAGALAAVEGLHSENYVHCDIKPANFMLRLHPNGTTSVVLIDFGSTLAIDPLTLTSDYNDNVGNGFTPDFASKRQHLGLPQGVADDLESLAYTLYKMYTHSRHLPWSAANIRNNKLKNLPLKREKIKDFFQEKDKEDAQAPKNPAAAAAAAAAHSGALPDTVPGTVIQAELRIVAGPPSTCCNTFFTKPLSQASAQESNLRFVRTRTKMWKHLSKNGSIPRFLVKWVRYCNKLQEGEKPDYAYLKSLLPIPTAGPLHLYNKAPPLAAELSNKLDTAPAVLAYALRHVSKKRKYEAMENVPTQALNEE